MKFAIDIKSDSIAGWVANEDHSDAGNFRVEIMRKNKCAGSTMQRIFRDDVFKAGLHPNGNCGFSLLASENNLKKGYFYTINIYCLDLILKKNLLFDNPLEAYEQYSKLEIDRNDFSILEIPLEKLSEGVSDLIYLKRLIIRLRRGKRSKSHRYEFSGSEYTDKKNDWLAFKAFIEENIDALLNILSVRSLISVCDTFADFADNGEKHAALAVSNIIMQEKFSQTIRCIYELNEKETKIFNHQLNSWGEMKTNCLKADDAYDLYLTRNLESLKEYPIIQKIFIKITCEMLKSENSIMRINVDNSEYFREMANFYLGMWGQSPIPKK